MISFKENLSKTSILQLGIIFTFITIMLLSLCSSFIGLGFAQRTNASTTLPDIEPEDGKIYVAVWIIDIYSFDFETGSYTFDMIFSFFWNDPNIDSIKWNLMNGAPNYSGAFYLIANGTETNGLSWEFHRATADLNTNFDAGDYPFDVIELPIYIEILGQGIPISLSWWEDEVGIDPGYKLQGWSDPEFELQILKQNYPYNIEVERAEMVVIHERLAQSSRSTMIPPLVFAIVSAFSFLLRMDVEGGIGMRIGLNTSMLISAVLYNISEDDNLPPSSGWTLWHIFMTSIIVFIALNTVVSVLGYLEFTRQKRVDRLRLLNRIGFFVSLVVPIVIFIVSYYFT